MVRNMSVLQTSLEWQAWHDALTRLLNRGALFEQAVAVASDCQRSGRPLAVIQLDLDHFKHINDRYGHQAGDRVLSMVASTLSSAVRQGDLLGRVGGEEFCIVMPNTTLQEAAAVAERLRQRIQGREVFLHNNVTLRVSASLGVSASEERGSISLKRCSRWPMGDSIWPSKMGVTRSVFAAQRSVSKTFRCRLAK